MLPCLQPQQERSRETYPRLHDRVCQPTLPAADCDYAVMRCSPLYMLAATHHRGQLNMTNNCLVLAFAVSCEGSIIRVDGWDFGLSCLASTGMR